MNHAILGVGGVGGLMAASLARIGENVVLVLRHESLAEYPEQLRLESPFGNFVAHFATAEKVPAVDVLWLAVKAPQLDASLAAIDDLSLPRAIVPLLNGVDHVALLRSRYGAECVIPATIAVESERVAPGHIVHRSPFANLNIAPGGRDLLQDIVNRLQQLGFKCRFQDDEATLLWSKLVFLAPIALTTTASGKNTSEVASDPQWSKHLQASVRETASVGLAEGAKLDAEKVIAMISAMPSGLRSSMQKDVEQGRPPELDAIGGAVLRGARKHALTVPVTQELVTMVETKIRQSM